MLNIHASETYASLVLLCYTYMLVGHMSHVCLTSSYMLNIHVSETFVTLVLRCQIYILVKRMSHHLPFIYFLFIVIVLLLLFLYIKYTCCVSHRLSCLCMLNIQATETYVSPLVRHNIRLFFCVQLSC